MAFKHPGPYAPGHPPVRYGTSKLTFRGPERDVSGRYIACLGGTETRGADIDAPWPTILEDGLGLPCVNFGWPNAGPDAFLNDEGIMTLGNGADAVILQILPTMNLSNPYYTVHPRRNDRFLCGTAKLRALYPDVDFTEFHFTRHMMRRLSTLAPDRFAQLRQALQDVWIARMQALLARIAPPVVLLWFGNHPPGDGTLSAEISDDPAFVSRDMLQAVRPGADQVVEVVISPDARAESTPHPVNPSTKEGADSARLPGPLAHREAARALLPAVQTVLPLS